MNTSKGQVDRVVYLSPDVATALRRWHRLQSATADYVFPSPMPRKGGLPLGARQIRNRMTRYLKLAGITKPLAAPSLQHAFAAAPQCRRLAGGGQRTHGAPLALQMTLRYTQLYDRTKRAQYDHAVARSSNNKAYTGGNPWTTSVRPPSTGFRRTWSAAILAPAVANYTLDLRLFFAEVSVPLAQVSFREVDQFVERQHHYDRAWATINRRLNALKHFCLLPGQPCGAWESP